MRMNALNTLKLAAIPLPPTDSINAVQCYHRAEKGLARLEPPAGSFLFGFSLMWDKDTPKSVNERFGRNMPIFK